MSLLLFTAYIKYVDTWMDKLLPMLTPLMYENGGPVLMVQVRQRFLYIMTVESLRQLLPHFLNYNQHQCPMMQVIILIDQGGGVFKEI